MRLDAISTARPIAMPRATARPWMLNVIYCPSPNLSAISARMASSASCSRSPLVSSTTSLPSPAASIITPMMLLALTRRSPLLSHTSHGKLPASLVSLAEARACRPSLLLMVVVIWGMSLSCLVLGCGVAHGHDALGATGLGAGAQRLQAFVSVADAAQQHRQIGAGDQACVDAVVEPLGHIAGRGAKHIAHQQHLLGAQALQGVLRAHQGVLGRLVGRHIDRQHIGAAVGKDVQRAFAQGAGQRCVGNDEDAIHGVELSVRKRRKKSHEATEHRPKTPKATW